MADDRESMWKAISELQKGQAATHQSVQDLTKSVDRLTETIERNLERDHQTHGEHSIEIVGLKKDVGAIGQKQRDHEDSHRRWASAVVGLTTAAIAVTEFLLNLFHRRGSQ